MKNKLIFIFIFYTILRSNILFAFTNIEIENASKAVVMIITYNAKGEAIGQGSGFFVDSEGILVTNLHVLQDAESGVVKLNTGAFFEIAAFLGYDPDMDIAILKVAGKDTPFLNLGDSSMLKKGDKVLALGNPMGLESTASEGIVSAIRYFENNAFRMLQITAPISPGSSGGPLLNTNGEVIGITTFLVEGQNLNFAIPIEYAKRQIAASSVQALGEEEMKKLENSATYFYIAGILAYDAGNLDTAEEYYKKAIEQDSKFVEAYYELEDIYYDKQMFSEEVKLNEELVKIAPNDYYAHHLLALAYETVNKEKEAIKEYKKAIKLKSDFPDSKYNLAFLYILHKDFKNAKVQIKELEKFNPRFASQLSRLIKMIQTK